MRSAIPIGGLVVPKLQSKLYLCLDWIHDTFQMRSLLLGVCALGCAAGKFNCTDFSVPPTATVSYERALALA